MAAEEPIVLPPPGRLATTHIRTSIHSVSESQEFPSDDDMPELSPVIKELSDDVDTESDSEEL